MIAFDDKRWEGLTGGYKIPYDPRPALRRLETGDDEASWNELWEELHGISGRAERMVQDLRPTPIKTVK